MTKSCSENEGINIFGPDYTQRDLFFDVISSDPQIENQSREKSPPLLECLPYYPDILLTGYDPETETEILYSIQWSEAMRMPNTFSLQFKPQRLHRIRKTANLRFFSFWPEMPQNSPESFKKLVYLMGSSASCDVLHIEMPENKSPYIPRNAFLAPLEYNGRPFHLPRPDSESQALKLLQIFNAMKIKGVVPEFDSLVVFPQTQQSNTFNASFNVL